MGVVVGVAVACSVCFFIAGVLVALLTAALVLKCKNSHKGQTAPDLAQPPPLYEEMELHQVRGQADVKVQSHGFHLEENVAYGHVQ